MKDERKTKKVLIEELESLRQRVKDLESGSGDRELAERIRKSELVLKNITDVVFQMDLDLNWLYVTPSVEKSRGYTPEEVLKQGIEKVLTPESINTIRQTLGEELAKEGMEGVDQKESRVMELQAYHKDGSLVWIEVISTFLRDEEGKVVGIQGVSRNITERKETQEETRRFKDQYKILFEADVDGILIRNMDGDLVRANPAACSLLRSTEEELIGTNIYEMVHSDDHDVIKRQLEEISDGRVFRGEGLVKRSDDSTFIGSATVSPVEYDGGPHMMTVLRDVTEIRLVEADLRESEEKYRELVEGTNDLIIRVDAKERLTFVNHMSNQVFGLDPEECLGKKAANFMHPDDRERSREWFSSCIKRKEKSAGFENRQVNSKNSEVFDVLWTYNFHYDVSGEFESVNAIGRNITHRKQIEDDLAKSEEKLQSISKYSPNFIMALDPDYNITFANRTLTGRPVEEIIGTNLLGYLTEESQQKFKDSVEHIEETGEQGIFEMSGEWSGDKNNVFESRMNPVYQEGEIASFILSSLDITERKEAEHELIKSEEKLRSITQNSPNFILTLDLDCNVTYINRTYTGKSVEEIIGTNLLEYVPEESKQEVKDAVAYVRETGKQGSWQTSHMFEDSKLSTFEARLSSVSQNGDVTSFILSIMDITDREQAQRDLVESELQVRNLYEAVHAGIILQSEDGTIKYANPIASEIFGMRKDEITGKTSMDPAWQMIMEDGTLVSGEDHPSMITVRTGKPVINAVRGLFSGDPEKTRWLLINTVPVHDEETGDLKDVMVTFNDITELKQAEKDLLRHYKLSDAFLEAMPCFAVLLKSDRTVVAANKIAKYMGGTIGHSCYGSIYGFEDPCWWCLAPKLLKTGEPQHTVVEALSVVWDAYWVPIEEDLYLHYAFDITERIHAEREKSKLEEQLQHAQKMESLGVLAGGIAHDFNNLLMGIVGNVGMARMKTSPEAPCYVYIDRIETAAERASELTNQMLAYSGRGKFLLRSINLTTLVEEMTHLLSTVMDKKVVLEMNLDKDIPAIEADPSQIQQVVMNLLTNASDALGGQSGFVAVSTGVITCDKSDFSGFHFGEDLADGEYVFIEVTDNGHGIDEKGLGSIFDPFYTTKEGGRGLGLSAVIGIIRGHQGAIDVTSMPDKGTTFKVLFPAGERPPEKADEEKPIHTDYVGEGTILVVDDERAVLEVARSILAEFGFNVITASDGLEALEVYEEYADEISLVLMDLTMPNMGGFEAFSQLKNFHKDIKVILSSGFTEEDALSEFSDSGLVDFIQKPYSPEKLISTIRKALKD